MGCNHPKAYAAGHFQATVDSHQWVRPIVFFDRGHQFFILAAQLRIADIDILNFYYIAIGSVKVMGK